MIVPMTGREVPFIFDDYVDPEFGTGCLKITPAHDINDYEIGLKHNLAEQSTSSMTTEPSAKEPACSSALTVSKRKSWRSRSFDKDGRPGKG
ncbi:MAG: class I tRNA ligase family protein [Desulfobacterales bacterium]|nr:class I tRNA ligase family protein [Desulfobacterales bacterium]